MSNIIEGGFGKKPPKEEQDLNTEQVVVEEVDVQAVTPESSFYPFERPFIGSYGVVTQFFKEGGIDMTIVRGRGGPDIGIPTDFLRRLTKNFSPLIIGDLVVLGTLPDQSIGPVAIRRIDALSSNTL
jgi:hypothetical protein